MKDNTKLKVGDGQFCNRLCAFLDQKTVGQVRKLLIAEIQYLDQIVECAQRAR